MVYLVKAKIKPFNPHINIKEMNYKPLIMQGVFVPKGETKLENQTKIREQCKAYLTKNLTKDHPDLEFKITFSVTPYDNKFTLIEDKQY